MCWMVTVAVPGKARMALERACGEASRTLHFTEPHAAVAAVFAPGSVQRVVTCGGCSCDFYSPPDEAPQARFAQARKRMERAGWKPARIERALQHMVDAEARPGAPRGSRPEFERFIEAVVREAGGVELFAYMLHDREPSSPMACDRTATRSLAELADIGFPPDARVAVHA